MVWISSCFLWLRRHLKMQWGTWERRGGKGEEEEKKPSEVSGKKKRSQQAKVVAFSECSSCTRRTEHRTGRDGTCRAELHQGAVSLSWIMTVFTLRSMLCATCNQNKSTFPLAKCSVINLHLWEVLKSWRITGDGNNPKFDSPFLNSEIQQYNLFGISVGKCTDSCQP